MRATTFINVSAGFPPSAARLPISSRVRTKLEFLLLEAVATSGSCSSFSFVPEIGGTIRVTLNHADFSSANSIHTERVSTFARRSRKVQSTKSIRDIAITWNSQRVSIAAWKKVFATVAGFSLRGLDLARTKPRGRKLALLNPHFQTIAIPGCDNLSGPRSGAGPFRMSHKFDVLILGAGAAGLLCAIEAGKRGRRVAILERADRAGKKILISGGGRCNFTNLYCAPENFYSANPHFAKSALARYEPADFIALVEKHNIPYHEKHLGQLFCDRSAQDIVTMLETECRASGVQIFLNCDIKKISRTDCFVACTDFEEFHAPALVVATGGLSIPKLGASSFGYDIARQFGLKIRETKPA